MSASFLNNFDALYAANVLELCRPFGAKELAALTALTHRKSHLPRGGSLFRQGQDMTSLYVMTGGLVKTHVDNEHGREQITSFLRPGNVIGLDALHTKRYKTAATALKESHVEEILVPRLRAALQEDRKLGMLLLDCVSSTLAGAEESIMLLGSKNGASRVAAFLLIQSLQRGSGNPRMNFALDMTRTDIGNYLNLTKEATCRHLRRLEKRALISVDNKSVAIRRFEELCAVAGLSSLASLKPLVPMTVDLDIT